MDDLTQPERELYWSQQTTQRLRSERDDISRRLRNAETWGHQEQIRADREAIIAELQRRPLEPGEALPEEDLRRLQSIARLPASTRNDHLKRFLESRLPALLVSAEKGGQLGLDLDRAVSGFQVEMSAPVDGKSHTYRLVKRLVTDLAEQSGAEQEWWLVPTRSLQEAQERAQREVRRAETESERQAAREKYWSIEEELARRPLEGQEHLDGPALAALHLVAERGPANRNSAQVAFLERYLPALLANAARAIKLDQDLEKATWGRNVGIAVRVGQFLEHYQIVDVTKELAPVEPAVEV